MRESGRCYNTLRIHREERKKEEKQSPEECPQEEECPISDEERIKKIGKMLQDLKVGSEELANQELFLVDQTKNILDGMRSTIVMLKKLTQGAISPRSTALLTQINASLMTLLMYYNFKVREIDKPYLLRYNPEYITEEGIPPIITQLSVNIQTLLNNFKKCYKEKEIT